MVSSSRMDMALSDVDFGMGLLLGFAGRE